MSAFPPSPRPDRRPNGGPALVVASLVAVTGQLYGLYRPGGPMQPAWFPGADKVALNTAALAEPELITEGAKRFGSQCMVLAVDIKRTGSGWEVYSHGGARPTGREARSWVTEAAERGAGEILLTSIDADGTQAGVDIEITRQVSRLVPVPVIASGGIGQLEHFKAALEEGEADAVLAASVFHRGIFSIREVKDYLAANGLPVRPRGD